MDVLDGIHTRARKKLLEAFNFVDENQDRKLSWEEIKTCFSTIEINVTRDDYLAFCKSDINNDGTLDFDEFCRFALSRLQKVFNEIDTDGNGRLDEHEIQNVLKKLSIHISIREIDSILHGMDQDGDLFISFPEFCDFFSDLPNVNIRAVAARWMYGVGFDIGVDQIPAPLPPPEVPIYQFMLAGGMGMAVSRTVVAPIEKIKILSEISTRGKVKMLPQLKSIFVNNGIRGLFAGNLTNCLRVVPNGAIVGLVYTNMIKYTPVDDIKNPHQPAWRFLSGTVAGLASNISTYPLDVVRTRLTIQDSNPNYIVKYNGIKDTIRTIVKQEGVRGLYKGMTPTLISLAPFIGIQQSLYDYLKIHVEESGTIAKSPALFLACGAFAGTVAQTIVHPLEVARRCMQCDKEVKRDSAIRKSLNYALRSLWREGGVRRLYAGLTPGVLKIVPSASISLLIRDALLGRLQNEF